MMRIAVHLFVAIAFCCLAGACDDSKDNYLKGSITDGYNMSFDETRLRLYSSALSIEYVVNDKEGEKVALRVTLDRNGETLSTGTKYDLKARGSVSRGQGFGSELPDLDTGDLEFEEYSETPGSSVSGTFNAVFVTSDGSKKTLRGGFLGDLEVI
ncbi:MAG: hypothetical protein GY854_12860 [Deltaproteobacteria bacterium]|nr:hypothetical protein [Deltaproteobacteria bacterium]